jgi:hypothetical protein
MKRIAAVSLAAAFGCGGGGMNVGATFNGVVHGQSMTPADAISSPARVTVSGVNAEVAAIVLTNVTGVCAKVTANTEPRNGKALVILLADFTALPLSITAPSSPATFNVYNPAGGGIPPAHLAVVNFAVNDATCTPVPAQSAVGTSGAVRINAISGGSYSGTYTIGFETGEQVTGDFHTASCSGLATYLAAATHSCG